MEKANMDIRRSIAFYDLKQWEVAKKLNVREETFSRWMRSELSLKRKAEILNVIDQLNMEKHG